MSSELSRYLSGGEETAKFNAPTYRKAKVTASNAAGSATITIGSTTGVVCKSLIPVAANDVVWCVQIGNELLIVNHVDTGWLVPTYASGQWTDYGGVHANRYRRVNGIVYIKGLANSNSTTSSTVFQLPVGFRPSSTSGHLFIGMTQGGAKRFDVRPNGSGYAGEVAYDVPAVGWNSLDCSFPVGEG